jgi:hypothetical protein
MISGDAYVCAFDDYLRHLLGLLDGLLDRVDRALAIDDYA